MGFYNYPRARTANSTKYISAPTISDHLVVSLEAPVELVSNDPRLCLQAFSLTSGTG